MAFRNFKGMKIPVPGVDTAVQILRPKCRYDCTVEGGIYTWHAWESDDGLNPPTQEEIEREIKRECEIYNYFLYEVKREKEYPEVREQLDMLYHDIKNNNLNNGTWIKTVEKIKQMYPKPQEPIPEF